MMSQSDPTHATVAMGKAMFESAVANFVAALGEIATFNFGR